MNSISFNNFRQFKEFKPINFQEILILVGKNNAGKSTLVKAFILLDSFLKERDVTRLDFNKKLAEKANIVNFGRAKNIFETEKNEIDFSLQREEVRISLKVVGDDSDVEARVRRFEIYDSKKDIKFIFYPYAKSLTIVRKKVEDVSSQNEIKKLSDEIKKITDELETSNHSKWSKEYLKIVDERNALQEKKNTLAQNFVSEETLDEYLNAPVEEIKKITNVNLISKLIDRLESTIKKNKLNIRKETKYKYEFLQNHKEQLKRLTEWVDLSYKVDFSFGKERDYIEIIRIMISKISLDALEMEINKQREKVVAEYSESIDTLKQNIYDDNYTRFGADAEALMASVERFKQLFLNATTHYFETNNSKQSALFHIRDDKNYLSQAIHAYFQNKIQKGNRIYRFLNKWLGLFEICKTFSGNLYAGEAYEVLIDKEKKLSDLGAGSLQIFRLLLQIANVFHEVKITGNRAFIFLEEPELNLHPKLQSLLADLLLDVCDDSNMKINFVVETHSEYFIRKTQVLVKENQFMKEPAISPFSVIYFDSDLSQRQMTYREDGRFAESFGTGFFDVSTGLTFQLL
jgi:predicted ATPase